MIKIICRNDVSTVQYTTPRVNHRVHEYRLEKSTLKIKPNESDAHKLEKEESKTEEEKKVEFILGNKSKGLSILNIDFLRQKHSYFAHYPNMRVELYNEFEPYRMS